MLNRYGKIFLFFIIIANSYHCYAANPEDPSAVWGDYCDSYLPCAMVNGTAEISSIGLSRIDKIKAYFSNFGKKPAMSENEFKDYLSTLTPSQRKNLVAVCIQKRGDSSKDFCEKSYLLDNEIAELHRSSSKPRSKLEELSDTKSYLLRQDDRLYQELKTACPNPKVHCSIGSGLEADLLKLNQEVKTFNNNSEAVQKLGRIESKTIAERSIAYEPTDLLVPRVLSTTNNDKGLENQISLKKPNKGSFKDPYAGVSNQISQDSINKNSNSLYQISMAVSKVTDTYIESQINSQANTGYSNIPNTNQVSDTPARSGSATIAVGDCEAKKQIIIATRIPDNASITASQETVMFMTKTIIDMIDSSCPTEPGVTSAQIAAERQLRQQQYAAAENACNAVQSGNRKCAPYKHY